MERVLRPVVLCGGAGSRLWPLSTPDRPKPFLALTGGETLLQQTLRRVADRDLYGEPILAASARHRFLAGEQAAQVGANAAILLEPATLGTAFAAACAALVAAEDDPAALLLILPADHQITDVEAFHRAVRTGATHAREGAVVLFGVTPTAAATGFGYIRRSEALGGGASAVATFVEKPAAEAAERLRAEGALWNAGIFLLRADRLLDELDMHEPAIAEAARASVGRARRDADFIRLADAALPAPRSLDHAVMERTRAAVVIEAGFGWSDIGAWSAVQALCPADAAGNVIQGPVQVVDGRGVYARSEGPAVAVVGLSDVIVVAGAGGVLVAARNAEQAVRQVGERTSEAAGR